MRVAAKQNTTTVAYSVASSWSAPRARSAASERATASAPTQPLDTTETATAAERSAARMAQQQEGPVVGDPPDEDPRAQPPHPAPALIQSTSPRKTDAPAAPRAWPGSAAAGRHFSARNERIAASAGPERPRFGRDLRDLGGTRRCIPASPVSSTNRSSRLGRRSQPGHRDPGVNQFGVHLFRRMLAEARADSPVGGGGMVSPRLSTPRPRPRASVVDADPRDPRPRTSATALEHQPPVLITPTCEQICSTSRAGARRRDRSAVRGDLLDQLPDCGGPAGQGRCRLCHQAAGSSAARRRCRAAASCRASRPVPLVGGGRGRPDERVIDPGPRGRRSAEGSAASTGPGSPAGQER